VGSTAVLTAGLKYLPDLLGEARRQWEARAAAQRVVARQLDPLLGAADELYGKILSLAQETSATS